MVSSTWLLPAGSCQTADYRIPQSHWQNLVPAPSATVQYILIDHADPVFVPGRASFNLPQPSGVDDLLLVVVASEREHTQLFVEGVCLTPQCRHIET